jgi:replicative DNA helicase Mcm
MPKSQEIKVRDIRAKHLDEIIVIEGIIRQASDVRPQVINAKFECPSCGTILSVLQLDTKFREPSRCACGRRGGFKVLSKEMVDTQRLVIEEPPDTLIGGQQPKRINAFVKEDLVEQNGRKDNSWSKSKSHRSIKRSSSSSIYWRSFNKI